MSENTAVVNGSFVNASFKYSVELCNELRGKNLDKAIQLLKRVELQKTPVRINRYKKKVAHKPGMGPGRYPVKVSKAVRGLLESAGKNAENKGLKREKLVIQTLEANRAVSARRAARFNRGKLTNFRIVVKEE